MEIYKKVLLLVMVVFMVSHPMLSSTVWAEVNSQSNADILVPPIIPKTANPQDYSQEEFSPWMYYVYRFAAVSVGSVPFSLLFATVAHDIHKTYDKSVEAEYFDNIYLPLFFSGPEKPVYSDPEVQTLLWATLGISLSIGVIDLVILLIKQKQSLTIDSLFK